MGSFAQSLTPQGPPPGPISNPDQDSLPSATLPGQPAQPSVSWNPAQPSGPANQTPDDQKQGMFHKLFSKLSGQDVQYDVDPSTGQMLAKPVQEKPGELFRNILAAGLMGSQGIDHAHGQNTFAQGLLAGAGAGVKESRDMAEKQDAARRAQAQQNYENQLRANQEQRAQKTFDRQGQLDKIAMYNEKIKAVAAAQAAAQTYGDKTLQDQATSVSAEIALNSPKVNMVKEAGIPFIKGLEAVTADEMIDPNTGKMTDLFLKNHPKAASDYDHAAVGTVKVKVLGPDGNQMVETATDAGGQPITDMDGNPIKIPKWKNEAIYGFFPKQTVVTDGMISQAKKMKLDETDKGLFGEMSAANAAWNANHKPGDDATDYKGPGAVPVSKIVAFRSALKSSEDFQEHMDKHFKSQADTNKDVASASRDYAETKMIKDGILDKEGTRQAGIDSLTVLNTDGSIKPEYNKLPENRKDNLKLYLNGVVSQLAETAKTLAPKEDKDHPGHYLDASPGYDAVDKQLGTTITQLKTLLNGGNPISGKPAPPPGSNGVTTNPEGPVKIAPNGEKVSPGQPTKEPAWDNHAALVRFTDPKTGVATYSIQHSAGLYDPNEFEGGIKAWYKRTYGKEPGKDDIKFSGNESGLLLDAPENANWVDKSTAEAAEKAQRKANATPTFAN